MVEFAMVLPAMLLLMLGVAELGHALVRYNALTKAARDAVRYAAAYALQGTSGSVRIDTALETEVQNLVVYGNTVGAGQPMFAGLATSQVTVVDVGADQVRVDIDFPYQPLVAPNIPGFGFGAGIATSFTMSASASMRAL